MIGEGCHIQYPYSIVAALFLLGDLQPPLSNIQDFGVHHPIVTISGSRIPTSVLHKVLRWLGHCYSFDRAQQLIYEADPMGDQLDYTTSLGPKKGSNSGAKSTWTTCPPPKFS